MKMRRSYGADGCSGRSLMGPTRHPHEQWEIRGNPRVVLIMHSVDGFGLIRIIHLPPNHHTVGVGYANGEWGAHSTRSGWARIICQQTRARRRIGALGANFATNGPPGGQKVDPGRAAGSCRSNDPLKNKKK